MSEDNKEQKTTQDKPREDSAQGWADLSSLLGSYSTAKRQDRQTVAGQTQNYDQIMLQAQQAREQAERDALRKLATTGYITGGGAPYTPATIDFQGKQSQLPSFGFGPKAPSQAQVKGASTLQDQLAKRLQPGGSYTPTPLQSYTKPGTGERIADIGGLITGGLGALDTITGGDNPISRYLGGIMPGGSGRPPQLGNLNSVVDRLMGSGGTGTAATGTGTGIQGLIGKAMPYAGAATGVLGLMKDRGFLGNVGNGITAGASIGSIVPGIGTAIGAGVGGLVGALRGLGGGPSETELAGRDAAAQGRSMIASLANPKQIQEAQGAGWQNPQDALTFIVMRDKFGEGIASQMMHQIHSSEKQGPEAVQRILASIAAGR